MKSIRKFLRKLSIYSIIGLLAFMLIKIVLLYTAIAIVLGMLAYIIIPNKKEK